MGAAELADEYPRAAHDVILAGLTFEVTVVNAAQVSESYTGSGDEDEPKKYMYPSATIRIPMTTKSIIVMDDIDEDELGTDTGAGTLVAIYIMILKKSSAN